MFYKSISMFVNTIMSLRSDTFSMMRIRKWKVPPASDPRATLLALEMGQ